MNPATSITGIPTDLLITGFALLCAAIGGVMWKELRWLRNSAIRRDKHLTFWFTTICGKLGINYRPDDY